MTRRRLAIALWILFAFVTWNVVFDRAVTTAALGFTREQIVRYQQGASTASMDTAFRPRVRQAVLTASAYSGAVLLAGLLLIRFANRNPRHPASRI